MKVDLVHRPPTGIHWNNAEIGKTYQSVDNPDAVVIPFWYASETSNKDVKMALPIHTAYNGHPFRAFCPANSSRWVEVESTIRILGKV